MSMLAKDQVIEKFSFISKSIHKGDFDKYKLFIERGTDSFNYLILNADKEIMALKSLEAITNVNKTVHPAFFIDKDELLQHRFKKVMIAVFDFPYTLVPNAFYQENQKEKFLQFATISGNRDLCFSDEISVLDSKLIYSIDGVTKEEVDFYYPNHRLFCGISLLLNQGSNQIKFKKSAILNFRKNAIDILICKEKMIFCNSFSVVTAEDVLYFLTSAIELNEMSQAELQLYIGGEIEYDSIWVKLIKKYFNQIHFINDEHRIAEFLIEKPQRHKFNNLFNLSTCE